MVDLIPPLSLNQPINSSARCKSLRQRNKTYNKKENTFVAGKGNLDMILESGGLKSDIVYPHLLRVYVALASGGPLHRFALHRSATIVFPWRSELPRMKESSCYMTCHTCLRLVIGSWVCSGALEVTPFGFHEGCSALPPFPP